MMTKIELGTISRATMCMEDLIPCFIEELKRIDISHEYQDAIKEGEDIIKQAEKDETVWDNEDTFNYLHEVLWGALDQFSPPYCYFGAHPGDGSDYGYWAENIEKDNFDGIMVKSLTDVPKGYTGYILENDITLYYNCPIELHEIWCIG